MQGKYAEAEQLLERALSINEAALGVDHKTTLISRGLLADFYKRQGFVDKASSLQAEVVSDVERVYGPEHPWVANALTNLTIMLITEVSDSR